MVQPEPLHIHQCFHAIPYEILKPIFAAFRKTIGYLARDTSLGQEKGCRAGSSGGGPKTAVPENVLRQARKAWTYVTRWYACGGAGLRFVCR